MQSHPPWFVASLQCGRGLPILCETVTWALGACDSWCCHVSRPVTLLVPTWARDSHVTSRVACSSSVGPLARWCQPAWQLPDSLSPFRVWPKTIQKEYPAAKGQCRAVRD
eukprot:1398561-Rhodomonas_salina.1